LRAGKAQARHFWVYAMAFRQSGDPFMWEMARTIALGNGLGDIGSKPGAAPATLHVQGSEPTALFGFLELYRATRSPVFLDAARQLGDAILKSRFNGGLFVARDRQFASFDRAEPLALLQLAATIEGRPQAVPAYPGGTGFYSADYGTKPNQYDSFIYALPRRPKSNQN
jgi:pectate lyase